MRASIIIPAWNAAHYLRETLPAIRKNLPEDCELIVVDDGSSDETVDVACEYADHVLSLDRNTGRSAAKNSGWRQASGELLIFFDADVLVRNDTIVKIIQFMDEHPEITALSGMLAMEHPHSGFFSQYKNLYMHYTFSRTPEDASFLYGSVLAVRRKDMTDYDADVGVTDDTALGQALKSQGKCLRLAKHIEVVHLKKHTLKTIILNDFEIPYCWARVFIKYAGWRQLFRKNTGYAHAPKSQLASVVLAPLVLFIALSGGGSAAGFYSVLTGLIIWAFLNRGFLSWMFNARAGSGWRASVVLWTFMDHHIMAAGILCGLLSTVHCPNNNDASQNHKGG